MNFYTVLYLIKKENYLFLSYVVILFFLMSHKSNFSIELETSLNFSGVSYNKIYSL